MSDTTDLASLFFQWSQAVDYYRDKNADSLTPDQNVLLKDLSSQLDDISTHFTLDDVAATIASIQPEIDQIKTATAQAKKTLAKLNTIDKVTKAIAAVVSIGVSAESGNVGGIVSGIGDLASATAPPPKTARATKKATS
jgi:hypothetical protein